MPKGKIKDIKKNIEELDADEQMATKGGATRTAITREELAAPPRLAEGAMRPMAASAGIPRIKEPLVADRRAAPARVTAKR